MTLEMWVPGEFPFDDPETAAIWLKANKIFQFTQGPVAALNSSKEVSPMSERISGVVDAVKIEGNRYAYKVGGKWVSCFVQKDADPDAVAGLKAIVEGDDVVFDVEENRGYLNIQSLIEHTKGDPSRAEQKKPGGYSFAKKSGGGGGGFKSNWKPEDKRPSMVSFALSYSKDIVNKMLEGDDMKSTAPEGQAKFVRDNLLVLADMMLSWSLKKVKELGYEFPKGE